MCYDISFTVNVRAIEDYFPDLVFDDQLDMDFGPIDHIQGVAVFARHPIVYIDRTDWTPHCSRFEWGIIPFYEKAEPPVVMRNKYLNIRSERIIDDPTSYWYKIKNRRCLIPVTGIFEHRTIQGWKKKVPYLIRPIDTPVFFLPGLYSVAETVDASTGEMIKRKTFGMLTRSANSLMRNIHNDGDNRYRMPLFLPFDLAQEWLDDNLSSEKYRSLLQFEIPPTALEYYPVFSIRSSKPRPDGKWKTVPWQWDNLPS
ncbi:SOS response-associated peptidase family protein [Flavihumibacter sp. CACIAM 22H1]|uniref:SOS response-associated peptidase n=1 Tax=Flavihumibacter sp. CACIAM 22H1 TaxID=1812911 RepID=UPI0007A860CF|nr:SOS response-associated peptidase family protein [Flavihumibacter sp. CACIAM 22H1]KYP16170.1 MAG: hypothetical protein A1D16_13985 [Flavihumibacter sp. CACIAM 22H1]